MAESTALSTTGPAVESSTGAWKGTRQVWPLWIWSGALLAILALIAVASFTVIQVLGPRPVRLIKLSAFDGPYRMGSLTYTRLRPELSDAPLLVVGVDPQREDHSFHPAVMEGFVRAYLGDEKMRGEEGAIRDGSQRSLRLLFEEGFPLPNLPSEVHTEAFRMKSRAGELKDLVLRAMERRERVVIYTHAYYASHLLKSNPIAHLESALGRRLPSLIFLGFAATSQELANLQPPCTGSERDRTGLAPLGCTLRHRSGLYMRKLKSVIQASHTPAAGKVAALQESTQVRDQTSAVAERAKTTAPYWGALEQVGEKDYLLFTHGPLALSSPGP